MQMLGVIDTGAPFCNASRAAAGHWFDRYKYVALALPRVFVIHSLGPSDYRRQAGSRRIMKLFHSFVDAHNGSPGIVRAPVDIQYVFHLGNESGTRLSDAPHLYVPGLEFVFLGTQTRQPWKSD